MVSAWRRLRRRRLGGLAAAALCALASVPAMAQPSRPLVMLVETSALMPQARIEGATIVSHDRALEAYGVPVIWT